MDSDSPDENPQNWTNKLDAISCQSNSTNNNPLMLSTYTNGKIANSKYSQCLHAMPAVVEPIYDQFNNHAVIISGPEYSFDLTYFLVHNNDDLRNLEREINLHEFASQVPIEESR